MDYQKYDMHAAIPPPTPIADAVSFFGRFRFRILFYMCSRQPPSVDWW